ncbi:MAG: sulfotransferase, partial [Rhodospirillaceae bacterium]
IAMLLPGAKIIHCRRQPMDSCLSCYTQHFTSPLPFATKLENLGNYYRGYEQIMAHWHDVLPLDILDVAYEGMFGDHEAKAREILEFCGLEWDEACLQFHLTERTVKTASIWQVRQPLYSSSVGRWRRYEGHLAPFKEALGDAYYEV